MGLLERARALLRRETPDATKIRTGNLLTEQARPSVGMGSNLHPWRDSVADSLTPEKLGRIMRDADHGNVEAYLTLAEEMEEREPHYRSVLSTRKLGVSGAPAMVESPSDASGISAIAEDVEQLVQRPEFECLVLDLMDAVGKGFSCVEIIWDRDSKRWEPVGYEHRTQRHFVFDEDTLSMPRLRSLENPVDGVPLQPWKWLVHRPRLLSGVPVRAGLARTVSVAYSAKRWTVADWLVFMDLYGIPLRLGKYPADQPWMKKALLKAVRALGSDAAAVMPVGAEIEFVNAASGNGGQSLFQMSAEYWDKQISKVVLGQTMTTDDGSSLAQANIHEEVRQDIRLADARAVAATINRDLIKPFVDLNYGPQEAYPKVKIRAERPEDRKSLMESVRVFVNLGGKVQMSEVRDRLGLPEPEEDAELLQPESAINAQHAPKPEPGGGPDGEGGEDEGPAGEDEEVEQDRDGRDAELNRELLAESRTEDVLDDVSDEAIDDWRPLLDENVGALLRRAQEAESYDDAREALDELARDHGEELALGLVTANLARACFRARGIGDATDSTEE